MSLECVEYYARCHCGALEARYRTAMPPARWYIGRDPLGAKSTSDPKGVLAFASTVPMPVRRYVIGLGPLELLVCESCDVYIGAQLTTEQGRFGTVTLSAFRPVLADLPDPAPVDCENATFADRQRRRLLHWTPVVALRS
jgi:hypothetical protein